MNFPRYIEDCLGEYPLEKIIISIEKFLIEKHIKYDILRNNGVEDVIIKIGDENINDIFDTIASGDIVSCENVIIGHLTLHELETNTMISFTYYDDLCAQFTLPEDIQE